MPSQGIYIIKAKYNLRHEIGYNFPAGVCKGSDGEDRFEADETLYLKIRKFWSNYSCLDYCLECFQSNDCQNINFMLNLIYGRICLFYIERNTNLALIA